MCVCVRVGCIVCALGVMSTLPPKGEGWTFPESRMDISRVACKKIG